MNKNTKSLDKNSHRCYNIFIVNKMGRYLFFHTKIIAITVFCLFGTLLWTVERQKSSINHICREVLIGYEKRRNNDGLENRH